jgi:hypothetical protein
LIVKRFKVALALLSLAAALGGCAGQIPVVGLDENGKTIEQLVKKRDYVARLASSVGDLQDSVVPVLDSEDGRSEREMRQMQLGLGLAGTVGIGEFFLVNK